MGLGPQNEEDKTGNTTARTQIQKVRRGPTDGLGEAPSVPNMVLDRARAQEPSGSGSSQ